MSSYSRQIVSQETLPACVCRRYFRPTAAWRAQDPQAEYEQLPREHELLSVVSQIVEAADRREDAAKLLASKVFTQMFEVTNSR